MTATQISPSQTLDAKVADSPCQTFLQAVVANGGLESAYDARDISEIVFRSIRDLMPTEISNRIATELDATESEFEVEPITLAKLWRDTNPLVRWLSQVRPPLEVKDEVFLRRIQQEAGIPKDVDASEVLMAVFGAMKAVLSSETAAEIASYLPGQIRFGWNRA